MPKRAEIYVSRGHGCDRPRGGGRSRPSTATWPSVRRTGVGGLHRELPADGTPAPAIDADVERELLARLVHAEEADVDSLVALMAEDVWLRMPPVPLEYQGRELAGRFFAAVAFRSGRRYRLVPTRANRQPAFGVYLREPLTELWRAFGFLVITASGDRITAITRFDNAVLPHFGLPRTLPGE